MWSFIVTPGDSQTEMVMKYQEEGGRIKDTDLSSHPVRKQVIKATSVKLTDTRLPSKSVLVLITTTVARASQGSTNGSAVPTTTHP
jgi:hypothetical protein